MGQHLNEKSEKEESKITQHQVDLPKDYGIKLLNISSTFYPAPATSSHPATSPTHLFRFLLVDPPALGAKIAFFFSLFSFKSCPLGRLNTNLLKPTFYVLHQKVCYLLGHLQLR